MTALSRLSSAVRRIACAAMLVAASAASVAQRAEAQVDTEATQQGLQTIIENLVLETLPSPIGDAVNAIANSPQIARAGLLVWIQRRINDAATRQQWDEWDRLQSVKQCLQGDCADLRALEARLAARDQARRRPGTPSAAGPQKLPTITHFSIAPKQIKKQQSARATVEFQTSVGGKVEVVLQSPGERLGTSPIRFTIENAKPGERIARNFEQFFPAPGSFALKVTVIDSAGAARAGASIEVTDTGQFNGHYRGTLLIETKLNETRRLQRRPLEFTIKDDVLTGTFGEPETSDAPPAQPDPRYQISTVRTIKGRVDDKGVVTGELASVRRLRIAKSGGEVAAAMRAPFNGTIDKDGVISGSFVAEAEGTADAVARDKDKLEFFLYRRIAEMYKAAPGRWTAKREK